MSELSNHESDMQYAIEITHMIFSIIGIWPLEKNASLYPKITKRLLNVFSYFLFLFILVPGFLRIFLKETQLHIRLKVFTPLVTCVTGMVKYTIILSQSGKINLALAEMKEDWRNVNALGVDPKIREIMLLNAKRGRQFVVLSCAFIFGGGIPFRTIVPLSKGRILLPDNSTVRALACPSYFLLFDEQVTPIYEIVFILQLIAGLLVYAVISGLTGLAAFFVLHICAQLRILINYIKELTKQDLLDDEIAGKQIAVIVEHQIKTIKFLEKVKEIIEPACLAEILGSTTLLCLTGYCIIVEWENQNTTSMITYCIFLASFTFCIFIWSYIGQVLDDQSTDVYLTSDTVDWYRLKPKQAKCLILIIATSSSTLKITANKMMDMSLRNFANIMKTSVAYLNILRQTAIE